jgi:S-adenosylmethionine:tRNA ribosyltransferase-isomerase
MSSTSRFPNDLSISAYGYDLPDDRIARYPLPDRTLSKLLVWKEGHLKESVYAELGEFLTPSSLLVFNNSRVVEARILFQKPSGGQIEIFCLEPHPSYAPVSQAMGQTGKVLWICLIGGASKWKRGQVLEKKTGEISLLARFIEKRTDDFVVEFSWIPAHLSFAVLLHQVGSIPLPPYLKRPAEISDEQRYQTVYARESGSVAAPTAGLHFSENLFHSLSEKGIETIYLTLHVGAGTFMPVKTDNISEHHMHEEYIEVTDATVERLISKLHEPVIAVGTTSLRTLETLYWLGLQISLNKDIPAAELSLDQWYAYRQPAILSIEESLHYLLEWILKQPDKKLATKTQLLIVPGYQFMIVRGLITNFHQPHSTLLLLVAALIGPVWKSVYTHALDHGYRFLSYGDGCLFLPGQTTL